MTKQERSPQRNLDSPNPRPKRRNKKQREGTKRGAAVEKSPPPSPPPNDDSNAYLALQSDSSDEDPTPEAPCTSHPNNGSIPGATDSLSRTHSTSGTQDTASATAQLKATLRIDDTQPLSTPPRQATSEILSVTLHSGRSPTSPPEPVQASELAHLAGELFGTPDNPIHPAPKQGSDNNVTTMANVPMETTNSLTQPVPLQQADGQPMEVEDSKPAAIPRPDPNIVTQQSVDPLSQLNERIERVTAQLKQLEEAKALLRGKTGSQGSSSYAAVLSKENPDVTTGNPQSKKAPPAPALSQPVPSNVPPTNSNLSPFASLATVRPVYPVIPDPSPKRPYFSRYSWRIDIPQGAESPAKGLAQAITEIWTVLREVDEKILIYPWKMADHGRHKPLTNPDKLPTTREGISRYFKDAYFRPHPGPMYIKVFLGMSTSHEELGKQTQHFFGTVKNKTRVGMWKSTLQFEDVVDIGWLFRSTPGMSPETISQELFAHTGIHTSLRWKVISQNARGELKKEDLVRALHISVRREDVNLAKAKFVRLIFAKHRRSHFIGGSPMRLIPINRDLSPVNKEKCKWIMQKQSEFLASLKSSEIFDIVNIDGKAVGLNGKTLRELILEIPLKETPNKSAFLSADRAFNQSSTKLYYYAANESECQSRVATLLPYLIFTNPTLEKGIRGCFNVYANERSSGVKWDPETQEVVTVDDEIFMSYDWESDGEDGKVLVDLSSAAMLPQGPKVQEGDNKSIFSQSTFRSQNTTGRVPSQTEETEDSDDTPKTINKATPTAQTEVMSSISEGLGTNHELLQKVEQMSAMILQLTQLIPNTPGNQAVLETIRSNLPNSLSAGCSGKSSAPSSSSGAGAKWGKFGRNHGVIHS
jgi:hypothetical protein